MMTLFSFGSGEKHGLLDGKQLFFFSPDSVSFLSGILQDLYFPRCTLWRSYVGAESGAIATFGGTPERNATIFTRTPGEWQMDGTRIL